MEDKAGPIAVLFIILILFGAVGGGCLDRLRKAIDKYRDVNARRALEKQ